MLRRNNNDITKKIGEGNVEGNRRNRPKKKWTGVIGENMEACGVNKNMVRDREVKNTNS